MKNLIFSVGLFLVFHSFAYGQVGIGTSSPKNSAMLEINSNNKGLLIPSIALNSSTDATTIASPATGLLVWNNGTGGLTTAGFYFWNNTQWNLISSASGNSINNGNNGTNSFSGWNTTGTNVGNYSAGNTPLSLGTSTLDDLIFKVNSSTMGRLGTNNSISFGAAASAAQNGIALGNSSSSYQGIAIGTNASVTSGESVAVGANTQISGFQSTALGYGAKVTVNEATAIGYGSAAGGYQSTAIGHNAKTTTNEATAIGKNSVAGGYQSIALGHNAKTASNGETALGINSQTNNQNSTALGSGTSATGQNSTAIGYGATTSQANAIILGDSNASVGIGTNSPTAATKIDVNGQYKLGEKGSVQKNQITFEVWPSVSINNLPSGKTTTLSITIPAAYQPGSTRASVVVSPANDFAGVSDFGVLNPRLSSTSTITIALNNISGNAASLYSGHFYITINEF
ncbi:hypothetical protein [Chryseobacterium limigenitum]|uniref:hypothetical protein n=1 Tax=Chryseobacterium limigenitum TaxID=1612149 RepID=UPI00147E0CD5|nr:hypothetical protein [Chryseobacterium limigenitum]